MKTFWWNRRSTPFGLLGSLLIAVAPAGAQAQGPLPVPPEPDRPGAPRPGTPLPGGPFGPAPGVRLPARGEAVRIIIGEDGRSEGRFFSRMMGNAWGDPTGASLANADETLRAQLEIPAGQGLVVTALVPDSLAAKAGLQPKDILLTFDGKPLGEVGDLARSWNASTKAVPLTLIRAGKTLTIEVPAGREANTGPDGFWIGIPVGKVDEVLRSHLDLPEGTGLVIIGVVPESPAARAGLKPGDILLTFDTKPVADAKALRAQVRASGEKLVPLGIVRGGKKLTIEVTPERRKAPLNRTEFNLGAVGGGGRVQFIGPGVVVQREGAVPGVLPDAPGFVWKKMGNDPVEASLKAILGQLKALDKSLDELKNTLKEGAAVKK